MADDAERMRVPPNLNSIGIELREMARTLLELADRARRVDDFPNQVSRNAQWVEHPDVHPDANDSDTARAAIKQVREAIIVAKQVLPTLEPMFSRLGTALDDLEGSYR